MATTKDDRRKLHEGINALSRLTVAKIIKKQFPTVKIETLNRLAKMVIAKAHDQVSPK